MLGNRTFKAKIKKFLVFQERTPKLNKLFIYFVIFKEFLKINLHNFHHNIFLMK